MIPQVYAIIDTCVFVSALRSRTGASFAVLRAALRGDFRIALSVSLAMEFEDVATRPGLVPLTPPQIGVVIDNLCSVAQLQQIFFTWRPHLPDADDDMVLELAIAAGAPFIITHNLRDFRGSEQFSIRAITPKKALTLI